MFKLPMFKAYSELSWSSIIQVKTFHIVNFFSDTILLNQFVTKKYLVLQ